ILTTGRETRRFQTSECAVFESADHCDRVINCNSNFFPRTEFGRSLFHKSLRDPAGFAELAHEITGKIDNVRENVAERARPRDIGLQTPDQRKIWIDNPI